MTASYPADPVSRRTGSRLDASRLWAGGLATALVAALIAIVGILIARGLFGVDVLAPGSAGVLGDASSAWYVCGAAGAALLATALMHLLVSFTPRPVRFFGWFMFLATAVAVLAPFATGGTTGAKVATGSINLILGVAIGTLIVGTTRGATKAIEPRPAALGYGEPLGDDRYDV